MFDLNIKDNEVEQFFKMLDLESNGFLNEKQLAKGGVRRTGPGSLQAGPVIQVLLSHKLIKDEAYGSTTEPWMPPATRLTALGGLLTCVLLAMLTGACVAK